MKGRIITFVLFAATATFIQPSVADAGHVEGMSLYRGYFVPNKGDPTGNSSRKVGVDDKGRAIIQVVADSAGEWAKEGLNVNDCFVWNAGSRTREKVPCPFELNQEPFVETLVELGEQINDPGPSCFCEGYYRHCINSCVLYSIVGSELATQLAAQFAGHDVPWNAKRDLCDIEANQTGIDIAVREPGPWNVSPRRNCAARCSLAFLAKFNAICCSESQPQLKKSDPKCKRNSTSNCRIGSRFDSYAAP